MSTEKQFKRGDSHPSGDGRVFWRYAANNRQERWVTGAAFSNYVNNGNERQRRMYSKPENKQKILDSNRAYRIGYTKNRYKRDFAFDVEYRVTRRTSREFKIRGWGRPCTVKCLVGCDWPTLCKILESRFLEGMTWENRSEWHIDHRIPLCSALNVEELCKLCHHDNLYPLWAIDNKRKGGRVDDNSTTHFSF